MRLFKCAVCAQLLYFETTRCDTCGHVLGYEHEQNRLLALETEDEGAHATWRTAPPSEARYRFCSNAAYGVCNWLIDAASADAFCLACRHNGIIPDLSQPPNAVNWQRIEIAKHRLLYTLLRLQLPLQTRAEDPEGLLFNFLADSPFDPNARVMTGHDSGLITLAIAEADDAERERRRSLMGEPYRTLLGHFRHETGHYFWDRLVRDRNDLDAFRAVFGDDTRSYPDALQAYYSEGPPTDWQAHFVSAYASAHPWEDFAETWAHYLHIIDTMEMARAFNLRVEPRIDDSGQLEATIDFNPYKIASFQTIVDGWLPVSFAMNNINRCMGQPDLYPFILSPEVIGKLSFIHDLVREKPATPAEAAPVPAAATSG
ncbi:zinc-binding metallopeptidase family protein [Bradyrhizobium sp. 2TAF24]|uniref:zinc-binding metallopeptidase family protein n=1 Tax=Bradyrhizobium sp. 2TAF24 TaxID=3233011 RepID=UPI003F8DAFD7